MGSVDLTGLFLGPTIIINPFGVSGSAALPLYMSDVCNFLDTQGIRSKFVGNNDLPFIRFLIIHSLSVRITSAFQFTQVRVVSTS
jgi:hypothetical protein